MFLKVSFALIAELTLYLVFKLMLGGALEVMLDGTIGSNVRQIEFLEVMLDGTIGSNVRWDYWK